MKQLQGDCLELMKDLPDGSVDMAVTSPPYDKLRDYNGTISQWSFEKFQLIAQELYRVIKKGGVVVWIVGDATINGSETGTSFRQAQYFKEIGFNLHDTMIWQKMSVNQHKNRYIGGFEFMFIFSKSKPKTANLICDRKNKHAGKEIGGSWRDTDGTLKPLNGKKCGRIIKEYGVRTAIWDIHPECNHTNHPAVFPLAIPRDHILTWSNPGDIVLDPMMGSGTTGIACVVTGRDFIGMELDAEYFNVAKHRIEEAINNAVDARGLPGANERTP